MLDILLKANELKIVYDVSSLWVYTKQELKAWHSIHDIQHSWHVVSNVLQSTWKDFDGLGAVEIIRMLVKYAIFISRIEEHSGKKE